MVMRNFEHVSLSSLDQARALCAKHREKAAVVAGGTDLLGVLKDNIHPTYPGLLIDIKPISSLRFVKEDRKGLRIGALTTLAEVANNTTIREKFPLLTQAARAVASPQIRNMGTVGGNLCQEPRCWYYRSPENTFHCLRKGGQKCNALLGDNRYHSIFGAARTTPPACIAECPAHVSIPLYLDQIRQGNLDRAAQLVLERNPMPAITGRVCPHFCQANCSRRDLDDAVSTRAVERHLGDHILGNAAKFMKPPKKQTNKKAAIVGAGPAGLAAAFYLRRAGHRVTIFDRMPEAGGMLRYCIPAYRLPRKVLRGQIQALERMGVLFEQNTVIDKKEFKHLRKNHDGVFLATGAWRQKKLGIENEEMLLPGLDFLIDIENGRREAPGKNVWVIGGGSVAVDVAICARRLGAKKVTMACLEARDTMPAFPEDLAQALEEGIHLLPSWGPHRILTERGRITGMELIRCTSVLDRDGRFRPTFDPTTQKTVAADCVLVAIGQGTDLGYADRALKTERGQIIANPGTQASSLPSVFAGGDAVTGASSVIAAIAAGRRAALSLDAQFKRGRAQNDAKDVEEASCDINVEALGRLPRTMEPKRALLERAIDIEDTSTLDFHLVEAESKRCINCGCVAVNASDLAPALVALGARIKTTTRTLAAEDFFKASLMSTTALDPDELVTEILVPPSPPKSYQSYLKFRIRNAIDFPIVGLACSFTMKGGTIRDARIALGAVAAIPLRIREVEIFLIGKTPNEETAEMASSVAVRGSHPLLGNKFKVQIVRALLRKAIVGASTSS